VTDDRSSEGAHGPAPQRLWRLLNTPRSFDPRTARIAVGILGTIATTDAWVRYDPTHRDFFWLRCGIGAVALVGLVGMGRWSFRGLRLYTLAIATWLPLAVGYVAGSLGWNGPELALVGACIFVGVVFLQTGTDLLVGIALMAAGQATLVALLPPRGIPVASVAINLATGLCAGIATAVILIAYRARLQESLQWWRDACERERAALRHKSEFLNVMSHELRSPLHVIIGYSDQLRDELTNRHAHALARIRDSALDLLQLVDHTLQAARLEVGKLVVCVEDVDCTALFRELAENIATLPEARRGIAVRWHVAADLPRVRVDRLKLKEIVQNLVSNGLKYTERGTVTVDAAVDGDALRIAVRDTGPGIAPESLARLFGMFERIDEAGASRPGGVGLGLYIVHGLVALMGGRIAVESVVGDGSVFRVWLPLDVSAAPTVSLPATAARIRGAA
jgi:signal transduction histidine kinase